MFDLKRPCSDCPFRSDRPFYLDRSRAEEISASLLSGAPFLCHKTTHHDHEYEEGGEFYTLRGKEQFCAGARTIVEETETANQILQVGARLRWYDGRPLSHDTPVYPSLAEWVEAMDRRPKEEYGS